MNSKVCSLYGVTGFSRLIICYRHTSVLVLAYIMT